MRRVGRKYEISYLSFRDFTDRVLVVDDYSVQGRGDRHLAKASSGDQRRVEQVRRVWRAGKGAFGLFVARQEWRSRTVCPWSDAKAI